MFMQTVAGDDQSVRFLHVNQNFTEAIQELAEDGEFEGASLPSKRRTSHSVVTEQSSSPKQLQHIPRHDDLRLALNKWIPTADDKEWIFNTGPADFIVAGNGYRLCPALLLNANIFHILLDSAKASQHLRDSHQSRQKETESIRQRRQHVVLRIEANEEEKEKLWDQIDDLKAQYLQSFDKNEHGELFEHVYKVGEELEELEEEADEIEACLRDYTDPDLTGTQAQLSSLHKQIDQILETALVRIGMLSDTDNHSTLTAYPEDDARVSVSELSKTRQRLELLESEAFLHRDNYHFQFKQWAFSCKPKASLEKLEDEYYGFCINKKRKRVDDWVPDWEPEDGAFSPPPPPSLSRSIASIRTIGSSEAQSVSDPEKKQNFRRSCEENTGQSTPRIPSAALHRKISGACAYSAPSSSPHKRRKLDIDLETRRCSI
ncbi:hypothetical protein K491DRAFT_714224 [Lophiostoma macrostomum CBS 122681]|uniref:Uncharacterized protein n=1 Tax=Lophiostoma macrostomum CBS 122681 TaxID=1314788 RepID=A0A6A6TEL7_9PLEO|nr:hypothetical protein K491DRAFT_714224 [Lophiostoma macrostomum CBS 122681]